MDKYKGKNRVLVVKVKNRDNSKYRKILEEKQKSDIRPEILDRKIVFITKINEKGESFKIELYGLDGELKHTTRTFSSFKNIFKVIDSMPMRKREIKRKTGKSTEKNKTNYSLYSDDNPKTTTHGTGYKNEEKALRTLEIIKGLDKTKQKRIINTLYYRAKHHPNQTKGMKMAMGIFSKWLKNN